jgi:hypothetical protein
MMDLEPPPADHDPELSRFLDRVVALSSDRHAYGPDAYLALVQELADDFGRLHKYRGARVLDERFRAFAEKRFDLVDDPSEHALAADEVMVLAMVLGPHAPLAFLAMKRAIHRLSAVLAEPGVPAAFGKLLRRLRQLARQHGDSELEAWVASVIGTLPSE